MKMLVTLPVLVLSLSCAKNKAETPPNDGRQETPVEAPKEFEASPGDSDNDMPAQVPNVLGSMPSPVPETHEPLKPTANLTGTWTTSCGLSIDGKAMKEVWTFDKGRLSYRYRVWFYSNTCSGPADSVAQDSQIDIYSTSNLGANVFGFDLTQAGTTFYLAFRFEGTRLLFTKACTEARLKRGMCSTLTGTTPDNRSLSFSDSTALTQVK